MKFLLLQNHHLQFSVNAILLFSPECIFSQLPSCQFQPLPLCQWHSPCPTSASASSSWCPPWWCLVVVFSRFSPGRKVCRRGERETPATLTTETGRAQGRGREEEEDRGKFAESECCRGGWKVRVEKALWYLNLTSGFETAPIPSHSPFQPLTYSATPHRGYSCCAPWNSPLRSFQG